MGNQPGRDFVSKNIIADEIKNKSIIEVGARTINFSVRSIFERHSPASYLGVDIVEGPGVDRLCNAEDLVRVFGKNSFDIVASFELLEHVANWQKVISNFKNSLKPGGSVLIGTRSRGFDYHGFPYDFWRYESEDMQAIFSDFQIVSLQKDPSCPGIFLKAVKPQDFYERDLTEYRLYSIVSHRRVKCASALELILVRTLFPVVIKIKTVLRSVLPAGARHFIRQRILARLP